MRCRFLFFLCLLLVLASPALGQEFAPDGVYRQIAANRNAYGRVIFLMGDSVSMMCSLKAVDFSLLRNAKKPADLVAAMATMMRLEADPKDAANDPLWPMHSLASAMNFLFAHSGLLVSEEHGATIPSARLVAAYGGSLGQPFPATVADKTREIIRRIDAGIIRDGDVVVFEDAGYHGENPDQYEDNWERLGRAVLTRVNVTLVMMDMFDHLPPGPVLGFPRASHQYLVMYKSPRVHGARSHNQATLDAARDLWKLPHRKGRIVFLDMRLAMDGLAHALRPLGLSPFSSEGIHPDIWGEALMVREILRGTGLASQLTDRNAYLHLLADNVSRLQPPARPVNQAKATALVAKWLAP